MAVRPFIPPETFKAGHPLQNHSTRVFEFVPEDVVDTIDWDHTADIDDMIANLWGFLQRSVRPYVISDGSALTFSDMSLELGDALAVFGSSVITVTLSNTGSEPLLLSSVDTTGDFVFLHTVP